MFELATLLPPHEAIDRLEEFLGSGANERIPQSLRAHRVTRVAVEARSQTTLTIRFGLEAPSKLVRYCDCVAEPAPKGSTIRFTPRGPWNPQLVAVLMGGLFGIQIVYQLITGEFDRITIIIALVVSSVATYLAHADNVMVRKQYTAGVAELLGAALPAKDPQSRF